MTAQNLQQTWLFIIDGSKESEEKINNMLFWDVNNGVARRSWARNKGAITAIKLAMKNNPKLVVTVPNLTDEKTLDELNF
jgi:urocanate hydratase